MGVSLALPVEIGLEMYGEKEIVLPFFTGHVARGLLLHFVRQVDPCHLGFTIKRFAKAKGDVSYAAPVAYVCLPFFLCMRQMYTIEIKGASINIGVSPKGNSGTDIIASVMVFALVTELWSIAPPELPPPSESVVT